MMLLADIGNTRVKWALAQGRELSGYGVAMHLGRPSMEIWQSVWNGVPQPQRVVISNVAGTSVADSARAYFQRRFQLTPEFMNPSPQAGGVTNGYTDAAQLGADRWAAVVGAFRRYGGPVCVLGCGTALTMDTVNRNGRHLGGLIAPGLGAMQRALTAAAPALPSGTVGQPTLFACDTHTAVSSGVLYAAAGFIERVVAEVRAREGTEIKLLLTGGDAETLQPWLHEQFTLAPHLVLEGLAVLAELRT